MQTTSTWRFRVQCFAGRSECLGGCGRETLQCAPGGTVTGRKLGLDPVVQQLFEVSTREALNVVLRSWPSRSGGLLDRPRMRHEVRMFNTVMGQVERLRLSPGESAQHRKEFCRCRAMLAALASKSLRFGPTPRRPRAATSRAGRSRPARGCRRPYVPRPALQLAVATGDSLGCACGLALQRKSIQWGGGGAHSQSLAQTSRIRLRGA